MVIDPMLYEKVSGRKGDPYERMGAALAGMDKRKADLQQERDRLQNARGFRGMGAQGAFLRLAIMKPVLAFVVLAVILGVIILIANL